MLVYEHDRTEEIVNRLMTIANIIRLLTVLGSILVFGVIGLAVGALEGSRYIGLAGIVGAVIGAFIGSKTFSFFEIVLEWMAQMIIAQGQIIAALNQDRRP